MNQGRQGGKTVELPVVKTVHEVDLNKACSAIHQSTFLHRNFAYGSFFYMGKINRMFLGRGITYSLGMTTLPQLNDWNIIYTQ